MAYHDTDIRSMSPTHADFLPQLKAIGQSLKKYASLRKYYRFLCISNLKLNDLIFREGGSLRSRIYLKR